MVSHKVCFFVLGFLVVSSTFAQRVQYPGRHHTNSHGGHYVGGYGSSHRGGHYRNTKTQNLYGRHKK